MRKYCSDHHTYSQTNPRVFCRKARHLCQVSLDKGYHVRCRNWRCSEECNRNASKQLSVCLCHYLASFRSKGFHVYRGCLKLPKDSPPDAHRSVKSAFLLSMKRWAKRHNYTLEMHGKLDISSPTDAHWDIILWTDAPKTSLKDYFGSAWKRAGGYHQSVVPIEPTEDEAYTRYHSKDTSKANRKQFIPAPQEVMPLDITWATRGFWGDYRTMRAVWKELITLWFPNPSPIIKTNITDTPEPQNDPQFGVLDPSELDVSLQPISLDSLLHKEDLTEFQKQVKERYLTIRPDYDRDRSRIWGTLPTDPSASLSVRDIADHWGYSDHYVVGILTMLRDHGATQTNGQIISGQHSFNRCYRSRIVPILGPQCSDEALKEFLVTGTVTEAMSIGVADGIRSP